jgi:methionyl-tRNA formyltransferase
MKKFVLLTEKTWHKLLFDTLKIRNNEEWKLINNKNDFKIEIIKEFQPELIFVPHWSYIIPKTIWSSFPCVVFHMTDLPYGRGGSPLQNLILSGKTKTKISALKVDNGIDTGDIILKKDLSLLGTAKEIFERATPIILEMIEEIIDKKLKPTKQEGTPVLFKRRKPEDSSIENIEDINRIFDYIRMLDCEGYPNAFIESSFFKFEFSNAELKKNEIIANVRISKK